MPEYSVIGLVEDPGAANMVCDLGEEMAAQGGVLRLFAAAWAPSFLKDRGVPFELWQDEAPPLLAGAAAVVVGSCDNPAGRARGLIDGAAALGIPSFGLVDTSANADRRYDDGTGNPFALLPDHLLVADALTQNAFVALGCAGDRLTVVGLPHLDRLRRLSLERSACRAALFPELDMSCRLVAFLAEGPDRLNSVVNFRRPGYTLGGRGRSDARNVVVFEEVVDAVAQLSGPSAVVVRPHPKTPPGEFAGMQDEMHGIYAGCELPTFLAAADVVVGMTSMALIEAVALGRPTLSVLPHPDEIDWLPPLRLGAIPIATTRAELEVRLHGISAVSADLTAIYPANAAQRIARSIATIALSR